MYYSLVYTKLEKTYQIATVLFILSVSLFTLHTSTFAGTLDQSAEEYRAKGYEEQQKGHFDKALTFYTKAISLGAENAVVFNDIGIVYEKLGIPVRAEKFYLKAIRNDRNYLAPYTNLAYLYKERGDTARALTFFLERLNRGSEQDPWKDRVKEELFAISPNLKKVLLAREAQELTMKVIREAKEKAYEEFNLQVARSQKHYQRGQQYFTERNMDEAVAEFDRALILTPDNPLILQAREEALYQKRIEDIQTRSGKAVEKLKSGEVESARKEFQKILATIPNESIQNSE